MDNRDILYLRATHYLDQWLAKGEKLLGKERCDELDRRKISLEMRILRREER